MRKLFAWGLPDEDQAPPETRSFTDPRHPGEEFALCLVRPGLLEEAAISEVAEAYCSEYLVTAADPRRGIEAKAAKPFLSPSGKRYPLNRAAIWEVSAVYCLQGGPVEDRYQWTDLLGVYLKRGRLWRPASAWAGTLLEEARESLGKPDETEPEPASEASSTGPSPTTTSPTPKPSRGKTDSSASSATVSAP